MRTDNRWNPKLPYRMPYRVIPIRSRDLESPTHKKRILIGLLVIALVAVSLAAFAFREGNDEQWNAMISRVTQLQSEAQSRDVSRSVLTGSATPGNSWDEYKF